MSHDHKIEISNEMDEFSSYTVIYGLAHDTEK